MSTIAERLSSIDTKLNNILTNANAELVEKGQSAVSDISHIATGIAGIQTGIDTSDATATAGDIVTGKTAYVDGQKITGTYTGIVPTGSISITTNGNVDVTNYASANVNVPTPSPTLQSKSVTITENGSQTITADSGYDGLSSVGVTVNVQGGSSKYNMLIDPVITSTNMNLWLKKNVIKIPELDFSAITDLSLFLNGFSSLITIEEFDVKNATSLNSCFYGCTSLTNIPQFNCKKATNMKDMFSGCTSLSNESLNNILLSCINGTALSSSNKNLKYLGLTSTQATTCTTLSNWASAQTAGWTTGY